MASCDFGFNNTVNKDMRDPSNPALQKLSMQKERAKPECYLSETRIRQVHLGPPIIWEIFFRSFSVLDRRSRDFASI